MAWNLTLFRCVIEQDHPPPLLQLTYLFPCPLFSCSTSDRDALCQSPGLTCRFQLPTLGMTTLLATADSLVTALGAVSGKARPARRQRRTHATTANEPACPRRCCMQKRRARPSSSSLRAARA